MSTQTVYDQMVTRGFEPSFVKILENIGFHPPRWTYDPLPEEEEDDDYEEWLKK